PRARAGGRSRGLRAGPSLHREAPAPPSDPPRRRRARRARIRAPARTAKAACCRGAGRRGPPRRGRRGGGACAPPARDEPAPSTARRGRRRSPPRARARKTRAAPVPGPRAGPGRSPACASPFPADEARSCPALQLALPAQKLGKARPLEVDPRAALHAAQEEIEGSAEALVELGLGLQAEELADGDGVEAELDLVARLHVFADVVGIETRQAVALPVREVHAAARLEDEVHEAPDEAALSLAGQRVEEFHLRAPAVGARHAALETKRLEDEGRGQPRPHEPARVGEVLVGDAVGAGRLREDAPYRLAGAEGNEIRRHFGEGNARQDVVEEDAGGCAAGKLVLPRLDHHSLALDALLVLVFHAAESAHAGVGRDDEAEVPLA